MNKKYKFVLIILACGVASFSFFKTSQAGFFDWFKFFKNNDLQSATAIVSEKKSKKDSWNLIGPSRGRINTVLSLKKDQFIVGSSSGGVFRTLDDGLTWKHYSNGLSSNNINYLKKINGKVYAATDDGIYVMQENVWIKKHSSEKEDDNFIFLAESSRKVAGASYFFALSSYNLYVSKDGNIWNKLLLSKTQKNYTLYVSTINNFMYVGNSNGVWQSDDFGMSWKNIFEAEDYIVSGITEDNDGNLYIIKNGLVFKKMKNQEGFKDITSFPKTSGFRSDIVYKDGVLYTSNVAGFLTSKDQGKTWKELKSQAYGTAEKNAFWDVRQIYISADKKIYLANDNGLCRININKTDDIILEKCSSPENNSEIYSMATSNEGKTIFVASWDHDGLFSFDLGKDGWFSDGGIGSESAYLSTPYGWINNSVISVDSGFVRLNNTITSLFTEDCRVDNLLNKSVAYDLKVYPIRGYVFCDSQKGDGVDLVSFDMEKSHTDNFNIKRNTLSLTFVNDIAINPKTVGNILANSNGKLLESLDDGKTWKELITHNRQVVKTTSNPFKEEFLIATNGEIIIRVFKKDGFWIKEETSVEKSDSIYTIDYDNEIPNVVYLGTKNGFYFSLNNGQTWKEFNKGLFSREIRVVNSTKSMVFIGVWGSGVAFIEKETLLKNRDK